MPSNITLHELEVSKFNQDGTVNTVSKGVYSSTPPTLSNGDKSPMALDQSGNIIVTLGTKIYGEDEINDVLKTEQRFSGVVVTSDTSVKSGSGFIHTLTFSCNDAAPTAGSIIVYDNTAGSGTIIYSETFDTTAFRGYSVMLDRTFGTGLYVDFTTTADINVAVSYR